MNRYTGFVREIQEVTGLKYQEICDHAQRIGCSTLRKDDVGDIVKSILAGGVSKRRPRATRRGRQKPDMNIVRRITAAVKETPGIRIGALARVCRISKEKAFFATLHVPQIYEEDGGGLFFTEINTIGGELC